MIFPKYVYAMAQAVIDHLDGNTEYEYQVGDLQRIATILFTHIQTHDLDLLHEAEARLANHDTG